MQITKIFKGLGLISISLILFILVLSIFYTQSFIICNFIWNCDLYNYAFINYTMISLCFYILLIMCTVTLVFFLAFIIGSGMKILEFCCPQYYDFDEIRPDNENIS